MKISDVAGKRKIDLNVDVGEGFPFDRELLQFASSANVCCGAHAGDQELSRYTVALCREYGVRVGAHPGYPDRESMGRASVDPEHQSAYLKSIFDQLAWFIKEAKPEYIKPHGAFYNDTAVLLPQTWETSTRHLPLATRYEVGGVYLAQFPGIQSLIVLLRIHKLPLMGLEPTAHQVVAERATQPLIREGFADRAYTPEGTLVPRNEPGAMLTDMALVKEQVLQIAPFVDSICLHGDGEDCLSFAELVVMTLTDAGYEVGH